MSLILTCTDCRSPTIIYHEYSDKDLSKNLRLGSAERHRSSIAKTKSTICSLGDAGYQLRSQEAALETS
jgi:hypothetical protein